MGNSNYWVTFRDELHLSGYYLIKVLGIKMNTNTREGRRGRRRRRFIIDRLNDIRFRNARRYPIIRQDIL